MSELLVAQGSRARVEFDGQIIRIVGRLGPSTFSKPVDEVFPVSDIQSATVQVPFALLMSNFQFAVNGAYKIVEIKKDQREAFDEIVRRLSARWAACESIAAALPTKLESLVAAPSTTPSTVGIVTYEDLRLGEVSRHFDTRTLGSITGFMNHSLGFEGWGVGVSTRRLSVDVSSLGLSGTSTVQLSESSVARSDLLNDGFVAVFETADLDTLRVVAPSDEAARSVLEEAIHSVYAGMKPDRRPSPASMSRLISKCHALISGEVSYVSDRLNAVLRSDDPRARRFDVLGVELAPHTLLGGAIRFGGDSTWHQLFPIALLRTIGSEQVSNGSSPSR